MFWMIGLCAAMSVVVVGYLRIAPSDAGHWHLPLSPRPAALATASREVVDLGNGAYVDLASGAARLGRLDLIAMATPRTTRLAGSVEAGRITWITRSRLWGFPDYTTAEVTAQGLTIYARARFGRGDLGVNGARLRAWVAQLP